MIVELLGQGRDGTGAQSWWNGRRHGRGESLNQRISSEASLRWGLAFFITLDKNFFISIMVVKHHGTMSKRRKNVERGYAFFGGVGAVRLYQGKKRGRETRPHRQPKESETSRELQAILASLMSKGAGMTDRLEKFVSTNPAFDEPSRSVLTEHFGVADHKELERRGRLLLRTVPDPRVRVTIYLELGKSEAPGKKGHLARVASNRLFSLDEQARFF